MSGEPSDPAAPDGEYPDHRDRLLHEMTGEHPAEHGLKTVISDMIDYIPMAVPLLIGSIQVHCETIAEHAEEMRKVEAENNANGKYSFFNVEGMIRDADAMLKRLHDGTK